MAHLLNLMLMLLSNNFFFLGAGGTMRLASDCAQLEFALSSILGPTGTRDILVLSENLVLNCVFYVQYFYGYPLIPMHWLPVVHI